MPIFFAACHSFYRIPRFFGTALDVRIDKPGISLLLRGGGVSAIRISTRCGINFALQGDGESVADYLTCIQAFFDRLNPPWNLTK